VNAVKEAELFYLCNAHHYEFVRCVFHYIYMCVYDEICSEYLSIYLSLQRYFFLVMVVGGGGYTHVHTHVHTHHND